MRSVAFFGFATTTRGGIAQSRADEFWSIGWAYKYDDLPRIDRLFELHPIWLQARSIKPEYEKARQHWAWLKQNTKYPVYMLTDHPEVPRSINYPIHEVMKLVPPARRKSVFTSSFDYMLALAIYEGFERIELYGFEMGSDTEYRYQREGAGYWIGQADARKIELIQPSNTVLLKKKLYGYEGGSMIYRQDLERLRVTREKQKVEEFARLNFIEGKMADAVQKLGSGSEEAQAFAEQWNEQYKKCTGLAYLCKEYEYLLQEVDLEEPEYDLVNPVGEIRI